VVTFVPREEVVDYLTENVVEAALAALRGAGDAEVSRRLLDHVNQRFRFSYVLGRSKIARDNHALDDVDVDDDDEDDESADDDFLGIDEFMREDDQLDLEETAGVVADAVAALGRVVKSKEGELRAALRRTRVTSVSWPNSSNRSWKRNFASRRISTRSLIASPMRSRSVHDSSCRRCPEKSAGLANQLGMGGQRPRRVHQVDLTVLEQLRAPIWSLAHPARQRNPGCWSVHTRLESGSPEARTHRW